MAQIGFVFSTVPIQIVSDFELRASDFRPKAGDWLCFFVPLRVIYCHNFLSKKSLRQFALSKIGFAFSNVPFQLVSDLELRISDFRAKPGELALFGFELALFFRAPQAGLLS